MQNVHASFVCHLWTTFTVYWVNSFSGLFVLVLTVYMWAKPLWDSRAPGVFDCSVSCFSFVCFSMLQDEFSCHGARFITIFTHSHRRVTVFMLRKAECCPESAWYICCPLKVAHSFICPHHPGGGGLAYYFYSFHFTLCFRTVVKCNIAKSQALYSAQRGLKTNNAAVLKVGAIMINIPQHPATLHSMMVRSSHQLSKQISDLIRQPSNTYVSSIYFLLQRLGNK